MTDLDFEQRGLVFVGWMRKLRSQFYGDDDVWLTRWAWKMAWRQESYFDVQARPELLARHVPQHGGVEDACGN